ncbi:hypothetical protein DXG03_005581 [Asterophora parasitica]|uniref:Uncharacterized protein n=1 Tax=Asterophora parasitica TaxID=117018 RepID=A0A9P7G689_9AGAR|nr:hypothetical protein DXG03_005581 [Asterophora parasitica]
MVEACMEFLIPMEHIFRNRVMEKTERTTVFTYVPKLVARKKSQAFIDFFLAADAWENLSSAGVARFLPADLIADACIPVMKGYDASTSCEVPTPPAALCASCVAQPAQVGPQPAAVNSKVDIAAEDDEERKELDEEEIQHMLRSLVELDDAEYEIQVMRDNIQALLPQHVRQTLTETAGEETKKSYADRGVDAAFPSTPAKVYVDQSATADLLPSPPPPAPAALEPSPDPQEDSLATANNSSSSSVDLWDPQHATGSQVPYPHRALGSPPSYYMYGFNAVWEEDILELDLGGGGGDGQESMITPSVSFECGFSDCRMRHGPAFKAMMARSSAMERDARVVAGESMDGPSALEVSGPVVGSVPQSTEPIEFEPQSPLLISNAADFPLSQPSEHALLQDQHDVVFNPYDADDESSSSDADDGDAGENDEEIEECGKVAENAEYDDSIEYDEECDVDSGLEDEDAQLTTDPETGLEDLSIASEAEDPFLTNIDCGVNNESDIELPPLSPDELKAMGIYEDSDNMGQEDDLAEFRVYEDPEHDVQEPPLIAGELVDPLQVPLPFSRCSSTLTSPATSPSASYSDLDALKVPLPPSICSSTTSPVTSPSPSYDDFDSLGMLTLHLEEFLAEQLGVEGAADEVEVDPNISLLFEYLEESEDAGEDEDIPPEPEPAIRDQEAEEKDCDDEENPPLSPHSEIVHDGVLKHLSLPPELLHSEPVQADDNQVHVSRDEVPEVEDENDGLGDDSPVASSSLPSEKSKVDVESNIPPDLLNPGKDEERPPGQSDIAQGKRMELDEVPIIPEQGGTSPEFLETRGTLIFDTNRGSPTDANPVSSLALCKNSKKVEDFDGVSPRPPSREDGEGRYSEGITRSIAQGTRGELDEGPTTPEREPQAKRRGTRAIFASSPELLEKRATLTPVDTNRPGPLSDANPVSGFRLKLRSTGRLLHGAFKNQPEGISPVPAPPPTSPAYIAPWRTQLVPRDAPVPTPTQSDTPTPTSPKRRTAYRPHGLWQAAVPSSGPASVCTPTPTPAPVPTSTAARRPPRKKLFVPAAFLQSGAKTDSPPNSPSKKKGLLGAGVLGNAIRALRSTKESAAKEGKAKPRGAVEAEVNYALLMPKALSSKFYAK